MSTRRSAGLARRWMGLVFVAAVAGAGAARAQPADLFFERMVMSAVDDRCGLFTPGVSAALAAGAAQARGAALRAGSDTRTLGAIARDARNHAARFDCKSRPVTTAAARVEDAFSAYQRVTRMTYRGDVSAWQADRGLGRTARWRLAQSADFGSNRMIFGLAGREGASALVAVANFADKRQPYGARLVMRDGTRTVGPYLDARPNQLLARKLPPRSVTRAYMAEARAGAETELLPKGAASTTVLLLGAGSLAAFAGLYFWEQRCPQPLLPID
ncbi:MAG: hypothetical protein U1C74_30795, partial [Phenylobacterium sp.]|nr:hypothetical protein [Phenylobacterium sp.]